jgi:hypothetical protein
VAWVQRDGPGTTCWHTATGGGCDQHLNPLPWLVIGIALFVAAWSRKLAGAEQTPLSECPGPTLTLPSDLTGGQPRGGMPEAGTTMLTVIRVHEGRNWA